MALKRYRVSLLLYPTAIIPYKNISWPLSQKKLKPY